MLLPWRARKQPSQLVLPISDPNPIWQDQVEHIHKLSDAHLALVSDVSLRPQHGPSSLHQLREVIRERALLEREYAAKLQALAKRASDKKARRMASVVLGDDPSRSWDESVIRKRYLQARSRCPCD
jgi:cell shape-determining protein MreC